MFEKLFGHKEKETSPEKAEHMVKKVIIYELKDGVNGATMYNAFTAAREENKRKNLGLTDNLLLNSTRDAALAFSGTIEDSLYGGVEKTNALIYSEIEKFRKEVQNSKE